MRSKMLRTFFVLEIAFYVLALVFTPLLNIWFSLALFLIGLHEIVKYSLFGADSFLWAGGIFSGVGVAGMARYFFSIPILHTILCCVLAVAFSSLVVFLFFRQYIHLKIFIYLSAAVALIFIMMYTRK